MTTPSTSDGPPAAQGGPREEAPFLPPARPRAAAHAPTLEPVDLRPPAETVDTPFLPPAVRPEPSPSAPSTDTSFDAKAMVESQKHFTANPAYGPLPTGTDEGRAAARKLREEANRKRRRGKIALRIVGVLVLAGVAVGAYFVYQALQDDPPPVIEPNPEADADAGVEPAGDGGALTPLGEQEQVIVALDDLNSGARPGAGALLDAVDDARDVVGQAEPPVAAPATLMVADVFTPAVLDHTDVLDPADGHERFVVRTGELTAINPSAHTALVERLLALPQVDDGDAQLAVAPVVLPGDIGIAIQRDGDQITRIVALATDPTIRTVGP